VELAFGAFTGGVEVEAGAFSPEDEDVMEVAFTAATLIFAGDKPTSL
jgi:hypothetical protein